VELHFCKSLNIKAHLFQPHAGTLKAKATLIAKSITHTGEGSSSHDVKAKVLLVDDDYSVRESLGRALLSEDYEVICASNGQEALERFCDDQIDVVLLDVNMPVINGWDALDQMKEINPFLPTIIITARPNQYERAAAAGAMAILEKPLALPVLLGLLNHVMQESLEARRQRMALRQPISIPTVPDQSTGS
jgi:CheY-like chemotaxis protein